MIAAAVAALPLCVVAVRAPWYQPWYWVFLVLAGEMLLVILAGLLASILMAFGQGGRMRCGKCGSPMFFAGSHFDPHGSRRPRLTDGLVLALFVGLNGAVWCVLWAM
jgi:hypothetical protein